MLLQQQIGLLLLFTVLDLHVLQSEHTHTEELFSFGIIVQKETCSYTEQPTPKQYRWIKSTTGKGKYIF